MGKRQKRQSEPTEPTIGPLPSYPYGTKRPAELGEQAKQTIEAVTGFKGFPTGPDGKSLEIPGLPLSHPPKATTLQGVPLIFIPHTTEATETDKGTNTEAEPSIGTPDTTPPTPEPPNTTPSAGTGDTLPASTAAVAADSAPLACNPNLKRDVFNRLMREGRWWDIAPLRDRMLKEAKASGMDKASAQQWVYTEIDRLYPPAPKGEPPPEPTISPVESPSQPSADAVPGLYVIPTDWPPLPDNASLQQELGWVQSQRLAVVEERGNATIVRLERASSPAPSKAALGWLETSIRSYAKYIEVAAKTLAGAADEAEATRRERMRLDDIRALLDEMHKDQV